MDRRMSRSMPLLLFPSPCFSSVRQQRRAFSPFWPERSSRGRTRRDYYIGGVRTTLIGADSYPNPSRSPRRLILCGPSGSYEKATRSSSTVELSRTGVYCSREDLRPRKEKKTPERRATSCEDVFRGTNVTATTLTTTWDSRLSESGVSLNDSRTDLGSSSCCLGLEDVDGVSQCSFGSSSAFHEITCDSEMDRPDDGVTAAHDSSDSAHRARGGRHGSGGLGGGRVKSRHDSGSRERFLAELTASSGRSSPRGDRDEGEEEEEKEFYHSTPTKRGSPVLSIFPGDEEDVHFPSHHHHHHLSTDSLQDSLNHSSADSLLSPLDLPESLPPPLPATSPPDSCADKKKTKQKQPTSAADLISSSEDTVKEALRRRRQQFFSSFSCSPSSSLQDCPKLVEQQQSAGESVQSWLSTGHPQPHTLALRADGDHHHHHPQRPHQQSPPSPAVGGRGGDEGGISVRDRVRAIERGPDSLKGQPDTAQTQTQGPALLLQTSEECCSGGSRGREKGGRAADSDSATTCTQQPLALKTGGGADTSRVSPHHPYPYPGTETASVLLQTPAPGLLPPPPPPGIGDESNVSAAEGARRKLLFNRSGFVNDDEPDFPDEGEKRTSLSSSSVLTEEKEKENRQTASQESGGIIPGYQGQERRETRLQVINAGGPRETSSPAADQLSDADDYYLAASADDRLANNTDACSTTTTAHPHLTLPSASTVRYGGGPSATSGVSNRTERSDAGTNGDCTTTHVAGGADRREDVGTGVTISPRPDNDVDRNVNGDTPRDGRNTDRTDSNDKGFTSLLSAFSDTADSADTGEEALRNDRADKESESEGSTLYHARLIQIVSPEEQGEQPSEQQGDGQQQRVVGEEEMTTDMDHHHHHHLTG
ncbi:uncharacterized protein LOC143299525 [Babylonia areolata]|uniref:uncharacterized protein LOC143299525 n=1 Tax=Babylonia areolata TaxID=304850 RepID=UPI003FD67A61